MIRRALATALLALLPFGVRADGLDELDELSNVVTPPTIQVRVTWYLPTGNPMYSGYYPYVGAAACSWNLPLGTIVRFADGREVECLDRGLLGSGDCGLMRTSAIGPILVLRHVAVETNNLKAAGIPFTAQPQIKTGAAGPSLHDGAAVSSSVVVDVVNAKKDQFGLAAAGATTAVDVEYLTSQPVEVVPLARSGLFRELLASPLPFGSTGIADLAPFGRITPGARRAFTHAPTTFAIAPIGRSMLLSAGFAHDAAFDRWGGPAAFTGAGRQASKTFGRIASGRFPTGQTEHLVGNRRSGTAGTASVSHDTSIPECGWIDIFVPAPAAGRVVATSYGSYQTVVIVRWGSGAGDANGFD